MGHFHPAALRRSTILEVQGLVFFIRKKMGKLAAETPNLQHLPPFIEQNCPGNGGEQKERPEDAFAKPVGQKIGVYKWIGSENNI